MWAGAVRIAPIEPYARSVRYIDEATREAPVRIAKWMGVALLAAIAVWAAGSFFIVAGIEEAKYAVIARADGYEVRRYEPALIAKTAMPTLSRTDTGTAFRAIAGYIFGGNETAQPIAMTAPVVMNAPPASEKIAMTAPVVMGEGTMAFVMPSKYKTLADLPKPKDGRVALREVPARTMAALRFSWYASPDRVAAQSSRLLSALQRDGVKVVGAPMLASYDPPFSIPVFKRHDILVEIER